MFDFDDPWWLVSVVLVVALWVMGAVVPVRMVAPRVSVAQHFVDMDDEPSQDLPPPLARPSLVLPVLTFLVSLGLVSLSLYKRMNEPEGGTRWTWMSAAAGISAFWELILVLVTMRIR